LYWGLFQQPSQSEDSSFINLAEVQTVVMGKVTEVFQRKAAAAAPDDCCFSLILKTRTVDLQAENADTANVWVEALRIAVNLAKNDAHQQWLAKKRAEALETRVSLTGKTAAETVAPRGAIPAPYSSQTVRLVRGQSVGQRPALHQVSSGSTSVSHGSDASQSSRATADRTHSAGSAGQMHGAGSEPSSPAVQGDDDDDSPQDQATDVGDDAALPTVISKMARRDSVQLVAANMQRNMERQQRMQNQRLFDGSAP